MLLMMSLVFSLHESQRDMHNCIEKDHNDNDDTQEDYFNSVDDTMNDSTNSRFDCHQLALIIVICVVKKLYERIE